MIRSVLITFFYFCFLFKCSYAEEAPKARLITISKGIEMVLKDSRLIKTALPDKEMAFEDSLIARSTLLPHFSAIARKDYFRFQPAAKFDSLQVKTAEKDPFSFGIDVYQTLFDFGKSLSNYQASKDILLARLANIESIKRVALLEFIIAYFNLLETEKMIQVAEKEVQSLNSYLNDVQHLYEQGVVIKNDLLPAQVRLADAKEKLIESRNKRESAALLLNNLLALPLRDKIAAQDITMQPPDFPEMDGALKTALGQRPEIIFYEDQIRASVFSERAKAVENFPALFLDAGFGYSQNRFLVHQGNASLGLGAKVDFYDGGRGRAELGKEQARQGQLKEQKNKLVEDIKFEIEDSFLSLKNSSEKVSVAQDAVKQAEENVRVNRAKYNAGSATTTDVLEAITLETKAQTNFFGDDYELKRNYAKLMYSMGIDLALVYERMENK